MYHGLFHPRFGDIKIISRLERILKPTKTKLLSLFCLLKWKEVGIVLIVSHMLHPSTYRELVGSKKRKEILRLFYTFKESQMNLKNLREGK